MTSHRQRKQKPGFFHRSFQVVIFGLVSCLLVVILIVVGELVIYNRFVRDLHAQNIVVASADPEDSQSVIVVLHVTPDHKIESVQLSPAISVEVIGGFGQYQLRSMLPLLKLDKKSNQDIRSAFSFALSTGVNHIWQDDSLSSEFTANQVQSLGWRLIRGQVKTDLSPWQQFHWGVYLIRVPVTDISSAQAASIEEWSSSKQWWSLGKLLHLCSVAIINTTDAAGLGAKVSQVLESTGFNVIRVTNDQTPKEQTVVFTDFNSDNPNQTCDQVLSLITSFIPHTTLTEYHTGVTQEHRANIVIILGEDNASL